MPNWISGCQVKNYLKPLTIEMLECIHKAKERAQTSLQLKQATKQEARQRQAQHKQCKSHPQPLHLMQITSTSSSRILYPQILVDVGAIGLPVTALIDTGSNTNIRPTPFKSDQFASLKIFWVANSSFECLSFACICVQV